MRVRALVSKVVTTPPRVCPVKATIKLSPSSVRMSSTMRRVMTGLFLFAATRRTPVLVAGSNDSTSPPVTTS